HVAPICARRRTAYVAPAFPITTGWHDSGDRARTHAKARRCRHSHRQAFGVARLGQFFSGHICEETAMTRRDLLKQTAAAGLWLARPRSAAAARRDGAVSRSDD